MRWIACICAGFVSAACCERVPESGVEVPIPERLTAGVALTVRVSSFTSPAGCDRCARPECTVLVSESVVDFQMARVSCPNFPPGTPRICQPECPSFFAECELPALAPGTYEVLVNGAPLPLRRTIAVTPEG